MINHPMVYEGKNGWLFLKGDTNDIVKQISGAYPLENDFAQSWENLLQYREDQARKFGYTYALSIAPNKECVYSQYLPEDIAFSEQRPVRHVLGADKAGRLVYHLDTFDVPGPEIVYNKNDTHWNSFGSILAFNRLMKKLGLRPLYPDRFVRKIETIGGDLGKKIGRQEQVMKYMLTTPAGKPKENNAVTNIGSRIVFENPDKSLPRCVIFHDSFTVSQYFFFPERFSRVVYVWQPNIDYSIVEHERPDFVLSQQAERFMVQCPDDWNGFSQKEYERQKKEAAISA